MKIRQFILIAIPLWIMAVDVILKYGMYIEWYIEKLFTGA